MSNDGDVQRFGEHQNAFGALRLLFASLVIVAHTPEMIDGNRVREPLTRLFGTLSFGELAVDGFFLISGYLIVGSFLKEPRAWPYLRKRIARIYPGFIVASLISLLIVAPLGGARPADSLRSASISMARILALQIPITQDIPFANTPYPLVNGAMWTIPHEFRCYLLVLLLGVTGLLRRPEILAVATVALLGAFATVSSQTWLAIDGLPLHQIWSDSQVIVRLAGIYLVGLLFYLWRERIHFTLSLTIGAAIALIACMFVPLLAEPGLALFGGYLIFALARWGSSGWLSRINNRDDISYGVYLYGWPAGKLLLWYAPALPMAAAMALTFAIACVFGWLSWHFVEKPVMRRLRRPGRQPALSRAGSTKAVS